LEKSAAGEHFVEASRAKWKRMMERRLEKRPLCALPIDATPFEGPRMVAASGIGRDGRKTILGIRQGATENAMVMSELLNDLVSSGLDFTEPRLDIPDCAKALTAGDPALPSPQAPQRIESSDRRTETGGREEAQRGLRC